MALVTRRIRVLSVGSSSVAEEEEEEVMMERFGLLSGEGCESEGDEPAPVEEEEEEAPPGRSTGRERELANVAVKKKT